MFSGSLEKQSTHCFPFITIISQISIVKFLHFKVLSKPRTLKCENLTILI